MKIKFTFDARNIVEQMREMQRPVAEGAYAALKEAAEISVAEGRRDIAGAGRFTSGWLTGLTYRLSPDKPSLRARATIFHKLGLAGTFQTGRVIKGRPLLWLPIIGNLPPRVRSPRQYGGKLVSVNVGRRRPMLFARGGKVPLFVGVEQVRIPKKFHVIEIIERTANRLGELFIKHFKGN